MTADGSATATIEAQAPAPAVSMTIFTKNDCPRCLSTERAFNRDGVPYEEINVETDLEPRDEFGGLTPVEYVKANYGLQMPVVVVTDDMGWNDWWSGLAMNKWLETITKFRDAGLIIPENERVKH